MTTLRGLLILALLALAIAPATAQASAELDAQLARLTRLGTIVYVTAHPDDESGPVITYFARGLHARVVILCLTRGEGGQNQVGPELGEELAQVRMRELQQAAAGYGAEVRFLGAEDFGYSKSVEETLRLWGEAQMLAELVRQLRELRPLVVISRWTGTPLDGGGAHHQAAGLLARKAFALAGDPAAFPDQLRHGYQPWQPHFLVVHVPASAEPPGFEVPVSEASPVAGKSYEELGWEAFRNHRSQGLHLIERPRGRRSLLRVEAAHPEGVPAPSTAGELAPAVTDLPALFPGFGFLVKWRERLEQIRELAENSRKLTREGERTDAALSLVQGAGLLTALRRDLPEDDRSVEANGLRALLDSEQNRFLEAAAGLAGVEFTALTDRAALTPGERVWVGLSVRVAEPEVFRAVGFEFGGLRLEMLPEWGVEPLANETLDAEQRAEFLIAVPDKFEPEQIPSAPLRARATLRTGSLQLELRQPVLGLSAAGEAQRPRLVERLDLRRLFGRREPVTTAPAAQLEPAHLAPPLTLELKPPLQLLASLPGETIREWCVRLQAQRPDLGKVNVWIDVPHGWYTPLPQPVDLNATPAARRCFALTIPAHLEAGTYKLGAGAGWGPQSYWFSRRVEQAGTTIERTVYEPAGAEVRVVDVSIPAGLRVGYIGFNNDPVPALLAPLGVSFDLLDPPALAQGLEAFDAIVIATRAYDYRDDLPAQTRRLLDYVHAGGTLVVEHQGEDWNPTSFAPYPAAKPAHRRLERRLRPEHPLHDYPNQVIPDNQTFRVTDEAASVRVLNSESPVFNLPNVIGDADWQGWGQERGLYFWESWADEYRALLEMADHGEEPQRGSLLYARYGDGAYIYCGLALFRQVRAGVPGGVRLYLNLLSHRRALADANVSKTPSQAPGKQ